MQCFRPKLWVRFVARSKLAHNAAYGRFRIPDQKLYKEHPKEWNQPCDNHYGIELVRSVAEIGVVTDQVESDDRSDAGASAAHPAYARDGTRVV